MLVRVLPPAGASVSQPAVSANQCSFYKNALYKFTVITVLFGTGEIWQVNVHTMQRSAPSWWFCTSSTSGVDLS